MEFNDKIKSRRLELNLTLEDIAKIVGVSEATIQRYESGEIKNPRRDKIKLLADALQVTPAYLMGWSVDTEKKDKAKKFTNEELRLLSNYNKLNSLGKEKLIEYSNDLIETPKYIEKEYLMPVAAHDKEGNFSDEDIKHDLDIMDDDSEW